MVDDELLTKAAQCITGGDFLGAMDIFQTVMDNHSDSPVGFHGWAEAASARDGSRLDPSAARLARALRARQRDQHGWQCYLQRPP